MPRIALILALCLVLSGCTTPGFTLRCRITPAWHLRDCLAYPADVHEYAVPGHNS